MKVLELFAGSCSFSDVAKEYGHETFTVDSGLDLLTDDHYKKIDLVIDILELDVDKIPFEPDIIWASPPCTTFSIASCGTHWTAPNKDGSRYAKTNKAEIGLMLLEKTVAIIEHYKPKFFVIENPRGLMRKMNVLKNFKRYSVTYCQYGDSRMKPTDIWTNAPWTPKTMCKNGMSCHSAAPRGSNTGTQGLKHPYERSKIPYDLCKELLEVMV